MRRFDFIFGAARQVRGPVAGAGVDMWCVPLTCSYISGTINSAG
ncbi:hypothetical protein [Neomoorella mulderi]|nr:hypothetical protein [Moorella mulderi]